MTRTQSCQSPVQMSWCEGVSVSDWEDGTVLGPAPRLCPVSLKDALSTHNWSLITISGTITNIHMECSLSRQLSEQELHCLWTDSGQCK